jgi:hypothetical protein
VIALLVGMLVGTYFYLAWKAVNAKHANKPFGGYLGIYTQYDRMRDWADDAADLLELLLERDRARAQSATTDDDRFAIQQWVDKIAKQLEPRAIAGRDNPTLNCHGGEYGS